MYCNKCGRKIDEQTRRCDYCESVSDTNVHKSSQNTGLFWMLRIFAVLCAVVSLSCGISYFLEPVSIETIDTLSIVSNNLQNGGHATADEQYHYYFNETGLVRAEIDNDLMPETIYQTDNFFGLDRNWVYAYSDKIFFADTERIYCRTAEDVYSGIRANEMFRFFFAEDPKTYYCGSQTEPYPLTYNDVQIANIPAETVCQYGLKLYIFSGDVTNGVENTKIGLWQVDLDGGNPTQLLDFCPEYFVVWGEQAFFTNGEKVYVSNADGTDPQLLQNISVSGGLNVDEKYIYYVDAESGAIFRTNKNGKNSKRLTLEDCSSIVILDNWMYYLRWESGATHLCRMNLDDLDEQIVVENWD